MVKKEKLPIVIPTTGYISIARLAKYLKLNPEAFYFALPDETPLTKFGEEFKNALLNIEMFGNEKMQTTLGFFKEIALKPIIDQPIEEETKEIKSEEVMPEENESNVPINNDNVEMNDEDDLLIDENEDNESIEDKLKAIPETDTIFYKSRNNRHKMSNKN